MADCSTVGVKSPPNGFNAGTFVASSINNAAQPDRDTLISPETEATTEVYIVLVFTISSQFCVRANLAFAII